MMYITDWFTTLLSIARLESLVPPNLDSFNVWSSISTNSGSPRKEIILNMDQDNFWGQWSGVIMSKKVKLIWGQQLMLWKKVSDSTTHFAFCILPFTFCRPQDAFPHLCLNVQMPEKACALELYNLKKDPKEKRNLLAVMFTYKQLNGNVLL